MSRFNQVQKQIPAFILGLIVSIVPLSNASADDTEIFYGGDTISPKILMVLDTSLSMSKEVSAGKSRLTNMKQAVREFISNSDDVEIGLMRMNQISGAVIFPISDLSTSITETYTTISRPVTENHNNAKENSSGTVTNSALRIDKSKYIGLRFENIVIPRNTIITSAYLSLVPDQDCNEICTDLKIKIQGELTPDSKAFKSLKYNISQRALTSNEVAHNINDWAGTKTLKTGDLKDVIQEIISQSLWNTCVGTETCSNNALSLVIQPMLVGDQEQVYFNRQINSAVDRYSPVLTINFEAVTRSITNRNKLLEVLDEQKLTYHTPIVPALWEAAKYLSGGRLNGAQTEELKLSTTRSASEKSNLKRKHNEEQQAQLYELDKIHERVATKDALLPGSFIKIYPTGGTDDVPLVCNADDSNLNDEICKGIEITGPIPNDSSILPLYNSPLTDSCRADQASIILFTDGGAHHKSNSYNVANWWGKMINEIDNTDGITCDLSNNNGAGRAQTCGEALANKLKAGIDVANMAEQQKITLYTIGFNNNDTWLKKLAKQGENTPEAEARYSQASNSAELLSVFQAIANQVVSKTVTFSNSATSISSSNRLTHNDELYFSLFQPTDQAAWYGNLKKYKMGDNGVIYDQDDKVALNPVTGYFKNNTKGLWLNAGEEPDGENILQGGAAGQLPATRQIWVNESDTKETLIRLTTSTNKITNEDFGVADKDTKDALILTMINATSLGDPLHSTPIEVSYGAKEHSAVFYGDNQGYIHSIDSVTGVENWAFIPKKLLKKQKNIHDNKESSAHIYGMDGEIVKWQTARKTMLFMGMRRGGSSYYALDVTIADSPKLAWKISNTTQGFGKLGQTWSTPVKTKVMHNSTATDVLIFGGGYDTNQDSNSVRTADNVGNAIYIVNAEDGTLLKTITHQDMIYSIPSGIKAINIDNDPEKTADQLFVGDMGGQVIRVDIASNGDITRGIIASLSGNDEANNRRFYHAPDVSILENTGSSTLGIAIGSGYRAHPRNIVNQDRFYLLKQPLTLTTNVASNGPSTTYPTITAADLYDATDNNLGSSDTTKADTAYKDWKASEGWYIKLSASEKVLASSLTFDNTIWFTSYTPVAGAQHCANNSGQAKLYRLNASTAKPDYKDVLPKILDNKGLDETKSCDRVQCDATDRSTELVNSILPPRPNLINHGGKRLIGIGTEFYPTATNKTKRMYWTEK